ncbi:hypothetical protein [Verrucosispora sp. WMMD573]|uniref:hypothetical protein n=1 Tax=Verrucosispora sp. WMMD573 TaxID=3015149 RepID=UPI00248B8F6D|nr:hypothetical protein [Verrucosispora sp. WMMD573]WBB51978.1 hypothetical protein O7601_15240 [Verrucosispora sp. WMMD573]
MAPSGGRPVFFLGGLTAGGNLAGARHLAKHQPELHRRFGADRPFALVLRIVEPAAYGTDLTELVADVTDVAFQPEVPTTATAGAEPPDRRGSPPTGYVMET